MMEYKFYNLYDAFGNFDYSTKKELKQKVHACSYEQGKNNSMSVIVVILLLVLNNLN